MPTVLDIHLHTQRHSGDSVMNESDLYVHAKRAGLDGVVITEHHYQWSEEELQELREQILAPPNFVLLSGFEYSSRKGDMLVFGLKPHWATKIRPGREPEQAFREFKEAGATIIAAHPTRAGIPFDDRILDLAMDGIEVESCNLRPHEQRLGRKLAEGMDLPMTGSSDAHRIEDLGAYATWFDGSIECMADFLDCVRSGKFRPAARQPT